MPIYEYRCSACGHELEALQKLSDARLVTCPVCGKDALVKKVSAAGFQLKGSGWYVTDFRGGNKEAPAAKGDKAAAGDAKPAGDSAAGGENAKGDKAAASAPPPASTSAPSAPAATPAASSPSSASGTSSSSSSSSS
ncbi:MAG: zinc ribbon domain-containing protein [Proteobacteria bacterium]|nr:zinc ribbon domain-containing protein [Pseudomonadota bacterium]